MHLDYNFEMKSAESWYLSTYMLNTMPGLISLFLKPPCKKDGEIPTFTPKQTETKEMLL